MWGHPLTYGDLPMNLLHMAHAKNIKDAMLEWSLRGLSKYWKFKSEPLRKRGCWGELTSLQQVPGRLVDWTQMVKFWITLAFVIDLRETSIRSPECHTTPMGNPWADKVRSRRSIMIDLSSCRLPGHGLISNTRLCDKNKQDPDLTVWSRDVSATPCR